MAATGNRHPPLPDNKHFRILTLEPGLPGERIYCSLAVAELTGDESQDANVVYDALSYAFGPEHPTYEIILGVWPTYIRENLFNCLQRIRDPTAKSSLWIDTISINMNDPKERASQVSVMDKIYWGARSVIVWLGEKENDSELAMDMMSKTAANVSARVQWSSGARSALVQWSNRLYWSRTWIVQEFLLARDIMLICGSDRLEWPVLERFVRRVEKEHNRRSNGILSDWSTFVHTPAFRLLHQKAFHGEQRELLRDLLVQNRNTACFEPRDKIYAMLGLAADVDANRKIGVSYSIDKRPLLFAVIRHIAPEARDVLRWTRFVADILRIDHKQIQRAVLHERENDMSGQPPLGIHGFTTAKIVKCGSLDANLALRDGFLRESSRLEEWNSICSMLGHLSHTDIEKLETCLEALRVATQAGDKVSPGFALALRELHTGEPCLVVAFTSGCVDKQVLFGLGYGQVRAGHEAIQFPGSEIALAVEAGSCGASVSGCLLFPLPQPDSAIQESYDRLTSQRCSSHIIQSDAGCIEAVQQVHFHMKPLEILALAQ